MKLPLFSVKTLKTEMKFVKKARKIHKTFAKATTVRDKKKYKAEMKKIKIGLKKYRGEKDVNIKPQKRKSIQRKSSS